MKREIKFRGKTEAGKWVYGDILRVNEDVYIIPPKTKMEDWLTDYENFKVDPKTVGQFVGKENESEFYEDDVVKYFDDNEKCYGGQRWEQACISYDDCEFWPLNQPEQYKLYEVIGNIHDNPELIKL